MAKCEKYERDPVAVNIILLKNCVIYRMQGHP